MAYYMNILVKMLFLVLNNRFSRNEAFYLQFLISNLLIHHFFMIKETFSAMIEEAGFGNVEHENLTFGVVAIHSGFKI